MIRNNLDFQQVISIVDNKIHPKYLNKVQEIILLRSLEGKTYSQIAIEHNYGMEYIKTSGSDLWKLLSRAFEQQVNKSNCNSFIRRQITEFNHDKLSTIKQIESIDIDDDSQIPNPIAVKENIDSISLIAPKISNFQGRKFELEILKQWSEDLDCRFIMMTGIVGCGKTTLAIKAAEIIKEKFHRVIYLSMNNSQELKDSIKFCLHIFDPIKEVSSDINKLLIDLALYLKKHRCLIILDNLDSIIEFKQAGSYYRVECEQYAQFLRCLIATDHQSLVIAASHNRIKQLNFYSSRKVKFMHLKGMKSKALWSAFNLNAINNISQKVWEQICVYHLHNPELIKIVVINFEYLPMSDHNIYLRYAPYIEEIDLIISEELESLDEIAKEIVYWLAFNFTNHTSTKLFYRINHPRNKILKVIDFLKESSIIAEQDQGYILQPIFSDYIQRYLIKAAKLADSQRYFG